MTFLRDEVHAPADLQRIWSGIIATDAVDNTDRVSVVIPGLDRTLRWDDLRWPTRTDARVPRRGDECVVVVDDNNEMWIVTWWPQIPDSSGSGIGGSTTSSHDYTFQTATTTPPGSGAIRLNNSNQTLATQMYISTMTRSNFDLTIGLETLGTNQDLYVQDDGDSTHNFRYKITGSVVQGTGYVTVPVSFVSAGTAIANNSNSTLVVITPAPGSGGSSFPSYNVLDFGAIADDVFDSYSAIKAAADAANADGGGIVALPTGKYRTSQVLPAYSHVLYVGEGNYATELRVHSSGFTGAAMFSGVDTEWFGIQDMTFYGRGKAGPAQNGVNLTLSSGTVNRHVNLNRFRLQDFNGFGIYVNNPIMSKLDNVRVVNTTGHGIWLDTGTSTNLLECYVGGCDQAGYYLKTMTYMGMISCASESNGLSYFLDGTSNTTAVACGAEVSSDKNATYPGTHFKINGGVNNEFISCYAREFNTGANSGLKCFIDVLGGAQVTFSNFRGSASVVPANTWRVASGCNVAFRYCTFGSTGAVSSGTLTLEEDANRYVLLPATGTTTLAINRGSNINFSNFSFYTSRVLQWTIGSRSDGTEDFHFRDNINGRTLLLMKQATNRIGLAGAVPTSAVHLGGALAVPYANKTADYTVTEADSFLTADTTSNTVTFTLPTATGCAGRQYRFKRISGGANNATIAAASGETIEGVATYVLSALNAFVEIISNGSTNWHIVAK